MKSKLEDLLIQGETYISACPEEDFRAKASEAEWSKKEILGHLVDSAINNLQRFTEIQFHDKPYEIRGYQQDELVKANNYQQADTGQLLALWLALNHRIGDVMALQTAETLSFEVRFASGEIANLKFLMEDYVTHLEHHMDQIIDRTGSTNWVS